ncbi:MAG: DNA recombination protein RmuC, partial [Shewanella sp.]
KLSSGKGNLVRQAHLMQQLGVDTSKQLDKVLLEKALNDALDDTDSDPQADDARTPTSQDEVPQDEVTRDLP